MINSYLVKRFFFRIKKYGIFNTINKILNFLLNKNKIDLDNFKLDENLSLNDIFLTFGTDKGYLDGKKTYDYLKKKNKLEFENYFQWIKRKNIHSYDYALGANYAPFYEKYFDHIKKKNLKILEIGVANGHSSASFFYYFPNSTLYGIDIKDADKVFYKSKRMFYQKIDIMNSNQVLNYVNIHHSFDIIIDDSFHTYEGSANNFKNFFPILKYGGTYVLEDYNASDESRKIITDWNLKNKRKPMVFGYNTFEDVLKNLAEKKYFDCNILSDKSQKYLMENISSYNSHRSDHPHGSIAFINKINRS